MSAEVASGSRTRLLKIGDPAIELSSLNGEPAHSRSCPKSLAHAGSRGDISKHPSQVLSMAVELHGESFFLLGLLK
jgi:hypothetical protein